jgi:peroxiredoxin
MWAVLPCAQGLWQLPQAAGKNGFPHTHNQEQEMIKVGDTLPEATLMEYSEVEGNGCSIGPNPVPVAKAAAPARPWRCLRCPGAFTPTCSAKHVPGYLEKFSELKAAGVDEIWCVSVNDAFVMGAWARDLKASGKVRMLGDGDAAFTKATGLTLDLTGRGMGLRSNRYSMLVKDGKVATLNVEGTRQVRSQRRRPPCWRRPRADGPPAHNLAMR